MLNRITAALFLTLVVPAVALAATIQLPVTGQTGCWNASGASVACLGTGQDGDQTVGTPWPIPRFTDNSDGTVTDNLTGLFWLKDAGCIAGLTWQGALTLAATLEGDGSRCSLSDDSLAGAWRLPNTNELESLLAFSSSDTTPPLPAPNPFTNALNAYYWTSTTYVPTPQYAWTIGFIAGQIVHVPGTKSDSNNSWLVRDPLAPVTATITLPKTGQTGCWDASGNPISCSGTGQDGEKLKGAAWPVPRFTNPNGSTPVSGSVVMDQLTGLIWTKDISAAASTWQGALTTVAAMNVGSGTFGYTDWRLPNRRELMSLVDRQQLSSLPAGHPFTDVPSGKYIWSSTTYDYTSKDLGSFANMAWGLYLPDGNIDGNDKSDNDGAVWAVRGGGGVVPTSRNVTASVSGGNGTIASTNPLTVASGATASFTLAPAQGFNPSSTVTGTCPAGSFNGVVYTTGAVTSDCSVGFSFVPAVVGPIVTASVSGGNGTIASTNPLTVASGATASFTLAPAQGFNPSSTVTGTCPAGSFVGVTYTTGAVTSDCSLGFSFVNASSQSGILINGGSTYTVLPKVTLTLSPDSTPAFMQFSTDPSGTKWAAWKAYAATTTLALPSPDGLKTVSVRYGDSKKVVISGVSSATITLDKVKPTGTIIINNGDKYTNETSVTLSLTATDATSGVAGMQFSPDNKDWSSDWEDFNTVKQYDLPAGDGTKKVYVRFSDKAGNISASRNDSIILDTTAPTIVTFKINGGKATTTSSTVTLTLSVKGTATQMQLSNDGITWNDWQPYKGSVTKWPLAGSGPQTVQVKLKDAAGNISTPYISTSITVL